MFQYILYSKILLGIFFKHMQFFRWIYFCFCGSNQDWGLTPVLCGKDTVHGFAGVSELWAGVGKVIFSKSRDSPGCFLCKLCHKPPCSAVGMFFQALSSSFCLAKSDARNVIAYIWAVISHWQLSSFLKGQNRCLCLEILYILLSFLLWVQMEPRGNQSPNTFFFEGLIFPVRYAAFSFLFDCG